MDLEHSSFLAAATPNEALGNMADAGVDELDTSNGLSSRSLKKNNNNNIERTAHISTVIETNLPPAS